jgi:phage terminase large subunit-like protein
MGVIAQLLELPPEKRNRFIRKEMTDETVLALLYDWSETGRENQQAPPGDWRWWLILAGRMWGKTRTGAEWINAKALLARRTRQQIRFALVAETKSDCRDVIAEGESGILAKAPPWNMPKYESSKRRITWPDAYGHYSALSTMGFLYSGEEPDQLRGPQFHFAWVDEWAKYQYPDETMDNLEMALRLGDNPQGIITTTPRPLPMIKDMIEEAGEEDPRVVVTRGSSYDNYINISPKAIKNIVKKYEGTRIGRQELHAEILDDVEGGFWTRKLLEDNRLPRGAKLPEMTRIGVAIDPATTSGEKANETGIMVGGLGTNGIAYLFEDKSGVFSPEAWGRIGIETYDDYQGDAIIGERNNGGDLVKRNIRACEGGDTPKIKLVWASRGKHQRAEPIAAFHEQKRIRFIGSFPELEDQLIFFTPKGYEGIGSPDRGDAFVWLMWFLLVNSSVSYDPEDYADSAR